MIVSIVATLTMPRIVKNNEKHKNQVRQPKLVHPTRIGYTTNSWLRVFGIVFRGTTIQASWTCEKQRWHSMRIADDRGAFGKVLPSGFIPLSLLVGSMRTTSFWWTGPSLEDWPELSVLWDIMGMFGLWWLWKSLRSWDTESLHGHLHMDVHRCTQPLALSRQTITPRVKSFHSCVAHGEGTPLGRGGWWWDGPKGFPFVASWLQGEHLVV